METILKYYQDNGINLYKHTGISDYAFKQEDAVQVLLLLKTHNIKIIGVDILIQIKPDKYTYNTKPENYIYWDLENMRKEEIFNFLKNKIINFENDYPLFNTENIIFTFITDYSNKLFSTIKKRNEQYYNLITEYLDTNMTFADLYFYGLDEILIKLNLPQDIKNIIENNLLYKKQGLEKTKLIAKIIQSDLKGLTKISDILKLRRTNGKSKKGNNTKHPTSCNTMRC